MQESLAKLAQLKTEMRMEAVEDARVGQKPGRPSISDGPGADASRGLPVSMACLPGGRRMPLLKSMITTVCERNCNYCSLRSGHDTKRVSFTPDELARLVVEMTRAKMIEGVFLSSGIAGGSLRAQDRLVETAVILRRKLAYQGYIHLKVMPGVEYAQVEEGMRLADRISINLEGPTPNRLRLLAPEKRFSEELIRSLRWIDEIRRKLPAGQGWRGRWPSASTQFVVGAAGETDLELLRTVEQLNRQVSLARGYFSGFTPQRHTPLEHLPGCNLWREHWLYQASFLLREYGFGVEELPFTGPGNLPLETDPKLALARLTMAESPLELNRADRSALLHIPGIGLKGAETILRARRANPIRGIDDLHRLGISKRAWPFILADGRRPAWQPALLGGDGLQSAT